MSSLIIFMKKKKILALLQARTSSSRLPGKVLLDILGTPMLLRQIERENLVTFIDHLVVVTSSDINLDSVPDNPFGFTEIVGTSYVALQQQEKDNQDVEVILEPQTL